MRRRALTTVVAAAAMIGLTLAGGMTAAGATDADANAAAEGSASTQRPLPSGEPATDASTSRSSLIGGRQLNPANADAATSTGTGSISGRIGIEPGTNLYGTDPTLLVEVYRYTPENDWFTIARQSQQQAGTFSFTDLPAGQYIVRGLQQAADRALEDEFWTAKDDAWEADLVNVGSGSSATNITLSLGEYYLHSDRIAGSDRYDTAVRLSRSSFAPGIPVVYLASGANWPDALSAGPAASRLGGSLLLTDPNSVPQVVVDELVRLAPERVVIVGSRLSVSDAVYSRIASIVPSITRIGGSDRYDTSRKLVEDAFPAGLGGEIFLTTGNNFPDALSVGPVAGRLAVPVLLVDGHDRTASAATKATLKRLDISSVTAIGDANAITDSLLTDTVGSGGADWYNRISGKDRYATSRAINAAYPRPDALIDYTLVAVGTGFADALAASTVAAKVGAPISLIPRDCLPVDTVIQMMEQQLQWLILLGGPNTISDSVANDFTYCSWR